MTEPVEQRKPYQDDYDFQSPIKPSSQVDAIAWDAENHQMVVRFVSHNPAKPMSVYVYPDASPDDMVNLLAAESTGAAFNVWKKAPHNRWQHYFRLPDEAPIPDDPYAAPDQAYAPACEPPLDPPEV